MGKQIVGSLGDTSVKSVWYNGWFGEEKGVFKIRRNMKYWGSLEMDRKVREMWWAREN